MDILILGSTGMLGSMVLRYLSEKGLNITAPLRGELDDIKFNKYDWIINCIGVIKQKLKDPKEAILINALLPHRIAEKAPYSNIIQIATDCVFSGKRGHYTEIDKHDATDIYGKTKSLGEVHAPNFYNIRTSIVGPNGKLSLLDWFLSQKKGATIDGYTNHYWNGITTLQFAKMCYETIDQDEPFPNDFHYVPLDVVSKYELLKIFAKAFGREDIKIKPFKAEFCDRSLDTIYGKYPFTIEQMVQELADYVKK